jgi:hypothetical protein
MTPPGRDALAGLGRRAPALSLPRQLAAACRQREAPPGSRCRVCGRGRVILVWSPRFGFECPIAEHAT